MQLSGRRQIGSESDSAFNQQDACPRQSSQNGTVCYYDYDKAPYIPTDSLANEPGAIACDTSVQFKWCQKKSLSYLQEATSKDTLVHQIQVTLARDKMPERKEAAALAEEISLLLR